jgi:hypothetical protein
MIYVLKCYLQVDNTDHLAYIIDVVVNVVVVTTTDDVAQPLRRIVCFCFVQGTCNSAENAWIS